MTAEILLILSAAVLAYTYLGYPAILRLLCSSRKPEPVTELDGVRSVSVVVCVRNAETLMAAKIENLVSQSKVPGAYEIIIASDGSTDGTVGIAVEAAEKGRATAGDQRSIPEIRILDFKENRGKAAVLNEVVPQCRGEIVVFTDVRQEFSLDAIRNLCGAFADPKVGAVSGELVFKRKLADGPSAEGMDFYWRYEKFIRKAESCLDSTCGCTGAIYAIRRELYRAIHPDTLLDDMAIPLLIFLQGKRISFDESAKAYDEPSRDFKLEHRRKVRTLAGNFQLLAFYPELLNPLRNRIFFQIVSHKLMRLYCPWFLLLFFGTSGALALNEFWAVLLFTVQVFFCLLAGAGLLFQKGATPWFLSMPATFLSLNWAAVVGTWRFLRGDLTGKW